MLDKIIEQVKSYAAVKRLCIFLAAFMLTTTVIGGNHDIFYGSRGVTAPERACIAQDLDATGQNGIDSTLEDVEREIAAGAALAEAREPKLEEAGTDSSEGKDSVAVKSNAEDEEDADDEARAGETKTVKKAVETAEKAVTAEKDTAKAKKPDEKKSAEKERDREKDEKKKTADYKGKGYSYCPKIPMTAEHQEYTYNRCLERGLEYELVLAIIWRESRFNPNAVHYNANGTRDNGYMQINDINKKWLRDNYGITNLMDPYQNIDAGTAMLGRLTKKYGAHNAMLAYQYGEGGMVQRLKRGITTSKETEAAYKQRDYYRTII